MISVLFSPSLSRCTQVVCAAPTHPLSTKSYQVLNSKKETFILSLRAYRVTSLQPSGYCSFFILNNGNLKLNGKNRGKTAVYLKATRADRDRGASSIHGAERRELENGSMDMRQHN